MPDNTSQAKSKRQRNKVDLADQYHAIGIRAVAAAARCEGDENAPVSRQIEKRHQTAADPGSKAGLAGDELFGTAIRHVKNYICM
jgi:hypothetical protein